MAWRSLVAQIVVGVDLAFELAQPLRQHQRDESDILSVVGCRFLIDRGEG
jgi:hypothetical protein